MDHLHDDGSEQEQQPLDWLSRFLRAVAHQSALAPNRTLLCAGFLTAIAIWLTVTQLEFRTSRLDLLSKSASYNQRWLAYLEQFGQDDDAVVVVSHTQPQRVAQVLTQIGQHLEADERLSGVLYRKSVGAVGAKALHLMPPTELGQLDQLLKACSQFIGQDASLQLLTASTQAGQGHTSAMAAQLASALTQSQTGLERLKQSVPNDGPLLLEDEGKLGICLVRLPHADDKPAEAKALLACLNGHLTAARQKFTDVDIWLTGMPVLEWDESQSSQRDMQNATLLSLVGVAAIFVFGFGSWRMPIAAVACLAMGLTWTVGLATLFIGHLNLFSVAFGAIIAGLGIDYAIHLLSRMQTQGSQITVDRLPQALADAVGHCGKGIVTGAVTTAAAFAVAVLTPFRGMSELGIICAIGTMCCLVVTIWVLPATLVWQARAFPARERLATSEESAAPSSVAQPETIDWLARMHHHTMRGLSASNAWLLRCRLPVLVSVCAVTVWSTVQMAHLRYDHNLLNLQADDVPSVRAELELTRRSGQSAWFAISLARSPQEAVALHRRLAKLPSVARVEEIGSVIASAAAHPETGQLVAKCRAHAQQLVQQIDYQSAAAQLAAAPINAMQVVPASYRPMAGLDPNMSSQIQSLAQSIESMASPEPPTISDFPEPVQSRMASQDGQTFLLRIFARENLWQRENLAQFVKELESVDPRVTGHPIQTWYASGELENSYYQAGIYAFLTVTALLMLDLGSVRLVALALVPVCVSLVQLCGLLVWLGISFNAANMIVLPLILGIGIDDGVHIMHDFKTRRRSSFRLSSGTTLAVLLTSLTTMVGFGSMGIADHRGLQSLGIVLLLGVGLCLLNSWYTLPALLSYFGPQEFGTQEETLTQQVSSKPTSGSAKNTSAACSILLLQDIPILLSLPDYPDIKTG